MHCEHAMDTPVEFLTFDSRGIAVCPKCLARCECCGRRFHVDDVDASGLCGECAEIEAEEESESARTVEKIYAAQAA